MTATYEEMLKNVQKNREIKIGCMPVLAPYHFARLVVDFKKHYPDIKLVIDERIASEIQENYMMTAYVQFYMKNIHFMEEKRFS